MNKNLITFLISLFVAIGVVVLLILPAYSDIKSKKEDFKQREEEFNKKQELVLKVKELLGKYNDRIVDFDNLNLAIPSGNPATPDLLVNLNAISSSAGMVMENIDIKSAASALAGRTSRAASASGQSAQNFKTASISLTLAGTYDSLKNYLRLLEDNLRIIDISSIEFETKEGVFEFSIEMRAYYQ